MWHLVVLFFTMELKKSTKILKQLCSDFEFFSYGISDEIDALNSVLNLIIHVLESGKAYEKELWQLLRLCSLSGEYSNDKFQNPYSTFASFLDPSLTLRKHDKERESVLIQLRDKGIINFDDQYVYIRNKKKLGFAIMIHSLLKMQYQLSIYQKWQVLYTSIKKRHIQFNSISGEISEVFYDGDNSKKFLIHRFSEKNSRRMEIFDYIFSHPFRFVSFKEIKDNLFLNNDFNCSQILRESKIQTKDRVNRYIYIDYETKQLYFQPIYSEFPLSREIIPRLAQDPENF